MAGLIGKHSSAFDEEVVEQERDGILDAAERLIRRIGRRKTTVADIACDLGTSRTNVYRFFPTRAAIDLDVYARIAGSTLEVARAISRREDAAGIRLAAMFEDLYRQTRARLTDAPHIHELFVAAAEGKWEVAKWYCDEMTRIFEATIRDGLKAGELESDDPRNAARCALAAMISFVHPSLLEQRVVDGGNLEDELRSQTRFIMRALGNVRE
jgi:AcrR family transcriptional regulator